MVKCANIDRNTADCNCTYSGCERHGICCECLTYHRSKGQLPACYFDNETERTYDRSIRNFINSQKNK